MCVNVCMCLCECVCVCECVCMCECVCVHICGVCECVFDMCSLLLVLFLHRLHKSQSSTILAWQRT